MNAINPGSDPIYKRLYSFPEMVTDVLRSVLPAETLDALNLQSLEKVPASYVGEDFRQRHGDTVWRVQAAGEDGPWAYMLVLLEFQSSNDSTMALRVTEYTTMLHRELLRAKAAEPEDLPPVLPIVLYNGDSPWTAAREVRDLIAPTTPALAPYQPSQRYMLVDVSHAKADYAGKLMQAVAQLEQSGSPKELEQLVPPLTKLLVGSANEELRHAFADWMWWLYTRKRGPNDPATPPPELTLEEASMTLVERIGQWEDQWIRQGFEQGIEQGIEQGKQEQLRHLTEVRFGAETAERLFAAVLRENDPQRLDAIAEAVVRCETAEDLLRQATQGGPATDPNP